MESISNQIHELIGIRTRLLGLGYLLQSQGADSRPIDFEEQVESMVGVGLLLQDFCSTIERIEQTLGKLELKYAKINREMDDRVKDL